MAEEYPVLYAGKISFLHHGVDVGALEAHSTSLNFIRSIDIEHAMYNAHYALSEDGKRIGAMMIVSENYYGDVLEANELYGSFSVGLSGVVGFYSSPKKDYTMKQLGVYLKEIERDHKGNAWTIINSKHFLAPSSQTAATNVNVYVHRNGSGTIDALQMEFNRKESQLILEAANNVQ